jgi:hypothetical protein
LLRVVELDISLANQSFIQAIYRPLWKDLRGVSLRSPKYSDLSTLVSPSYMGRLHYLCVWYPGEVFLTTSEINSIKLRVREFEVAREPPRGGFG